MTQLLLRVDPTMSEEMKLFFLWPRLRHDISRRVCDQGPISFHSTIQIAQRIEGSDKFDEVSSFHPPPMPTTVHPSVDTTSPMDVDVQNVQLNHRQQHQQSNFRNPSYPNRCSLPDRDTQGRPKCFYCNYYGHVKRHCRRWLATQQLQNSQVAVVDSATLVALLENL